MSGVTALENLNVSGHQLTELDVSGLTSLGRLEVKDNYLTELKANNSSQMEKLNASGNPSLICIEVFGGITPTFTDLNASIFNEECGY